MQSPDAFGRFEGGYFRIEIYAGNSTTGLAENIFANPSLEEDIETT